MKYNSTNTNNQTHKTEQTNPIKSPLNDTRSGKYLIDVLGLVALSAQIGYIVPLISTL